MITVLLVLLIAASVLCGSFVDSEIGLVAPRVLCVGLLGRRIVRGAREPYVHIAGRDFIFEPDDTKPGDGRNTRIVVRDGVALFMLGQTTAQRGSTQGTAQRFDTFSGIDINTTASDTAASWVLASTTDAAYSTGVTPVVVVRKTVQDGRGWQSGYDETGAAAWRVAGAWSVRHTLYFLCPTALLTGHNYTLTAAGAVAIGDVVGTPASVAFNFDETESPSPSIMVNRLGFDSSPLVAKTVRVGGVWTGFQGEPLDVTDGDGASALHWWLLDAANRSRVLIDSRSSPDHTHATMWRTAEQPDDDTGAADASRNYVGSDVYEINLGRNIPAGRYVVSVSRLGVSAPFDIISGVYERLARSLMTGLLSQRNGVAIDLRPFDNFSRSPGGLAGADVFQTATKLIETGNGGVGGGGSGPGFAEVLAGRTSDACDSSLGVGNGGMQDAGDWDPRAIHLHGMRELVAVVEAHARFFSSDVLDLSAFVTDAERANTIPDVLDVVLFNIDFYASLQSDVHGGVRGGIEAGSHPRVAETSAAMSQAFYCYDYDSLASFAFAQAAAQASRAVAAYSRERADELRERAVRAYDFAVAHVGDAVVGSAALQAAAVTQLEDDWALAAIELHSVLPSNVTYTADFARLTTSMTAGGFVDGHQQYKSLLVCAQHAATAQLRSQCDAGVAALANLATAAVDSSSLRLAKMRFLPSVPQLTTGVGEEFLLAQALAPNTSLVTRNRMLEYMARAHDFRHGANPLQRVFITGVDATSVRNPLRADSLTTGDAPPAGLSIVGPVSFADATFPSGATLFPALSANNAYGFLGPAALHPANDLLWPAAHYFADAATAHQGEYVIHHQLAPSAAWALHLAAELHTFTDEPPPTAPRATSSTEPSTGMSSSTTPSTSTTADTSSTELAPAAATVVVADDTVMNTTSSIAPTVSGCERRDAFAWLSVLIVGNLLHRSEKEIFR